MPSSNAIRALSGVAVAGGIGVTVKHDSTRRINRVVRRRINPRQSPALTSLAKRVSYLAGPYAHPVAAAVIGALIRLSTGERGAGPLTASLGTLAFDNIARFFVHQPRPPKAGPHRGRYRYAYPSGHATAATAIAVAAVGEIAERLSPAERKLVWASVAGVALAVGWARLYLDEHWMDDVVGGWVAGAGIGLGAAALSS
ncbi:MAG: phosphatase PAP2 family protein [Gemmatimonadaceae bacterium]